MNIIYNTSLATFNDAVDNFFSWNPKNPFWFLLAMYLRKEGSLAIRYDYTGDKRNIIAPVADRAYWKTLNHNDKWPEGVKTISIVGNMSNNEMLIEIFDVFQKATEQEVVEKRFSNSISKHPQWEATFLLDATKSLLSLDDEWFANNFAELFNRVVYRIFAKDRSISFSPLSLEFNEIIASLIDSTTKRIYNPFAGTANLLSSFVESQTEYIGEEQNELNAAIGNLRILSSNIKGRVRVQDSIHLHSFDADLLISFPPYEGQPAQTYQELLISNKSTEERKQLEEAFGSRNDAITLVIRKCVVTGCKGIIIAPDSINFRMGRYDDLRRYLVSNDCVDMIISITAPLFSYASIPLAVYVINTNHRHKGCIRFVNICDTEKDCDLFLKSLSNDLLEEKQISKYVSLQEIIENNYILAPEAYVFPTLDEQEDRMRNIKELGTLLSYRQINIRQGLYLHSSFFGENKARVIHAKDLAYEDINNGQVFLVTKPCVMISPVGGKAVCIDPQGEKIYVQYRNQIFFEPKADIVLPQYLALQLNEEYVKNQMGNRPIQTSASIFVRTIFGRIKIIVPSLLEQQRIVDEYQLQLIGELGMEVDSLKNQRFNEFERNMHLRKHALKQVMNEVVPAARRISSFISSQDGLFSKDSIVAERSKSSLERYAVKLYHDVEKINFLISALTDETQFGEPKVIELSKFMAGYCYSKLSEKYQIFWFGHQVFYHDEIEQAKERLETLSNNGGGIYVTPPEVTAYIDPNCLTTVLDNIVANAVNHGFTNPEKMDYAIRIEFRNTIKESKEMAEICVMNNGNKLPSGVSPERIFTWGLGSGTGLGAWQAKNIVEHFGGEIMFIQHDDEPDGFNIEYRFTLPMSD